jgi:hypothetical protein
MKTITLQIPDELYARVEQAAADSARSPEALLRDSIEVLYREPVDDDVMNMQIAAMPAYTNEQLWAIANHRMRVDAALRRKALIAQVKISTLSDDDQAELDALGALWDRYVLLRSTALAALQERGFDIKTYLHLHPPKTD